MDCESGNEFLNIRVFIASIILLAQLQQDAAAAPNSTEPNKPAGVTLRAKAYAERASNFAKSGNYQKALEYSHAAIKLDPKFARAYLYRGSIYLTKQDFANALDDCTKAISLEPRISINYAMRAQVYEGLKKYKLALQDWNMAISIDPKNHDYYLRRATRYRQLEVYGQAINDCNMVLKMVSGKAKSAAYIERGLTYLSLKNFRKALKDYSTAIEISPERPLAYSLRSIVYRCLGRYYDEIKDLTSAIAINPQNGSLYLFRAGAYFQVGLLRESIDDSRKAANLSPFLWEAYQQTANAYEELGLYKESIQFRSKVLKIKGNDPLCWDDRARAYWNLRLFAEAMKDWQTGKRLAKPTELILMRLNNPLVNFSNLETIGRKTDDCFANSKRTTLPFRLLTCGHFTVPAYLNQTAVQLMVDTGCGRTRVWDSQLIRKEGTILQSQEADGNSYSYGFAECRKVELGSLAFSNLPLVVDTKPSHEKPVYGLLAGNILENFVVKIDYQTRKVILSNSLESSDTTKTTVVPMRLRDHCPICNVLVNGTMRASALLDTGSPSSLATDSLLDSNLTDKLSYPNKISGPWLGKLSSQKISIKRLRIGSLDCKSLVLNVYHSSDAPKAATEIILGNDFLQQFKSVSFDYRGRKIVFESK